jgi:erythromycin esterase-like protein
VAGNLLELHAALARRDSLDTLVSIRDAMAADHLAYVAERERTRGKVLVFLHNVHLRRTKAKLPWYEFWPTGAHLDQLLGERFAVIGGALGTSEANAIAAPEAGSVEARLLDLRSDSFLPTRRARGVVDGLEAVPTRTGSTRPDIPYTPLFAESVADLDVIAFLRTVTYTRGADPLPG